MSKAKKPTQAQLKKARALRKAAVVRPCPFCGKDVIQEFGTITGLPQIYHGYDTVCCLAGHTFDLDKWNKRA